VDIPKVAAELGVTAVVEGSVRRAGDRVRISAQLINAADGFHLWAERYDRTLQDVFAVQEEIASSIASALRVALAPGESEGILRDRPDDVRAYDLYLKGREQYFKYTQDSLREALELFERATQIEPEYALAWAGIADSYGQMLQWGLGSQTTDLIRLGFEAARRAVALNPKLAEGHKAEALVLRASGDKEGAQAALLRAVEANPRYTAAWINLGVQAYERCDLAGAERAHRRALETDPQSAFAGTWLCTVLLATLRPDESLATALLAVRSAANIFEKRGAYLGVASVHLRRGDLVAARQVLADARTAGVMGAGLQVLEAILAGRAGRWDQAGRLLTFAEPSLELNPTSIGWAIEISLARGEMPRALAFAKRAIFADIHTATVRLNPAFRPLLDQAPFGPPVTPMTLVWPSEAPPVPDDVAALFAAVRVESGRPTPTGT
jgi:adenylate cyclase